MDYSLSATYSDFSVTSSLAPITNTEMLSVPPNLRIEFFDEAKTTFGSWLEKLEDFFSISQITDENYKLNFLLHYIGTDNCKLICNTISPHKVEERTYEYIKKKLKDYFNQKPLHEVAEYYKFYHRHQENGESIREYIAVLRKMAVNCNFGPYLLKALRNQLVCGVQSKKIKNCLLETRNLNFEKAVEICTSLESTEDKVTQMAELNESVYKLKKANYDNKQKVKPSTAILNSEIGIEKIPHQILLKMEPEDNNENGILIVNEVISENFSEIVDSFQIKIEEPEMSYQIIDAAPKNLM